MIHFPNDQLEKIRITLEDEKSQMQKRVDELTKQDPFSDPGRLSDNAANDMEASEESDHDRLSAVMEELKEKIAQIDAALTRIGEGLYGQCANCGNQIQAERLRILPMATLCLECEGKRKKK